MVKAEDYVDPVFQNLKLKSEILGETFLSVSTARKMPKKTRDRIVYFLKALNRTKIMLPSLRHLAFQGIPDEVKSLRPLVWRLLLNYLPLRPEEWMSYIKSQKELYDSFRKELIIEP